MTLLKSIAAALQRGLVACVMLGLVLQGCATPVTNEAGDSCVPFRAGLQRIVDQYNQNITQNVAGGVLTGVAAGIAIGAASGDVGLGALIGGIAGGIAGAAKGYYENKQAQAANNAELRIAISNDIGQATGFVRSVAADTTRLNQCRLNQLAQLRGRILAGGNGPAERQELESIRRRIQQDQELIQQVVGDVTAGQEIYGDAFAQSRNIGTGQVTPRAAVYRPLIQGGTGGSSASGATFVRAGTVRSTAYATTSSNVRSGPGTGYGKIGGVSRGQSIGVVSGTPGSGWVEINFGGRQGYIAGRLLSTSRPSNPSPAPAPTPAATNLPVVNVSTRPQGANEVDTLAIETKELEAQSTAQKAYLENEVDSIQALLE